MTDLMRLFPFFDGFFSSSLPTDPSMLVGRTLSDALKEMKSENGTSQTHSPKYEAISVKVGKFWGVEVEVYW